FWTSPTYGYAPSTSDARVATGFRARCRYDLHSDGSGCMGHYRGVGVMSATPCAGCPRRTVSHSPRLMFSTHELVSRGMLSRKSRDVSTPRAQSSSDVATQSIVRLAYSFGCLSNR